LSICVPTFNRANELRALLNSIPCNNFDVEVVVCDDGSVDNTAAVVEEYVGVLAIRYVTQANSGRAVALHRAIAAATGTFIVLMDSDDYFTQGGVRVIIDTLHEYTTIDAFVFGLQLKTKDGLVDNVPPKLMTNFISLRADQKIKGDLKEVVRTSILKPCLYELTPGVRRVPTYLLWSRVAEHTRCLSIPKAVAVKEYLAGGMTERILQLKIRDSGPMTLLYAQLADSSAYRSVSYRWRSRILWARHAHHAQTLRVTVWWHWLVAAPGWFVYLFDLHRLRSARAR
jgi:glycosyltransferase involved in cell wall biosynthesis